MNTKIYSCNNISEDNSQTELISGKKGKYMGHQGNESHYFLIIIKAMIKIKEGLLYPCLSACHSTIIRYSSISYVVENAL